MGNQISKVTVNEAMEGYFATLKLEHIKSEYDVITKELFRLNNLDKLLESTARKRKNISVLKEKQKILQPEYNALYPLVEEWLKFVFQAEKKKDYLKAAREYYSKIEIPKDAFQKVINRIFPPITCKLTEEQLKKLALKEEELMTEDEKLESTEDGTKDKIQYKICPRYYASNIRHDINTAWINIIESK